MITIDARCSEKLFILLFMALPVSTFSRTLLILAFCGVTGPLRAQENPDEKGFNLVKEKDNIFIYERWIFFPKTDPPVDAREVKSVFFAKTTIHHAVALLKNEAKIQQWQSHVEKFKVYPHTDSTWHEYSYHDIPWPVSDQDHFLEYQVREEIPGERLFVTFESIPNATLAPVDDDATRMRLSGSWLFEKRENDVKITYRILSFPIGIPRIFTDPVIRSNIMSTIKSYIKVVEEESVR
jgi:hypothetical protein